MVGGIRGGGNAGQYDVWWGLTRFTLPCPCPCTNPDTGPLSCAGHGDDHDRRRRCGFTQGLERLGGYPRDLRQQRLAGT